MAPESPVIAVTGTSSRIVLPIDEYDQDRSPALGQLRKTSNEEPLADHVPLKVSWDMAAVSLISSNEPPDAEIWMVACAVVITAPAGAG